ncbi:hypothetical protein FRC08_016770 [Ceratobasidium sp. 394]|nr:hypothetical protein FRC08_016770 [Ceratobasidium sp. 394]
MSNNLVNPDKPIPSYYVATHKGRSAIIKRDADYQTTIKLVQKSIPNLRSANVQDIFISTTLADCGDGLLLISEEIWPELVNHVKAIEVTLEDQPAEASPTPPLSASMARTATPRDTATSTAVAPESPTAIPAEPVRSVSITVQTVARKCFKFTDLPISKTISEIKSLVEAQSGVPAALQWLDISG